MLAITIALFLAMTADQTGSDATPEPAASTSSASTTAERTRADPDRLICRKESKPNTRFTYKVCKTAAEWEQRAETARQALADTQQRPVVSVCPPSGC